jgi:hypothetical protein
MEQGTNIPPRFFSVLHVKESPTDALRMAVLSFESFIRKNPGTPLHIVLVNGGVAADPAPPMLASLGARYGDAVVIHTVPIAEEDLYRHRIFRYALRFHRQVRDVVGPGPKVYMDFDLYHLDSSVGELSEWVRWDKLNACLDSSGYISNRRAVAQHNAGAPYVNTGYLAWDDDCPMVSALLDTVVAEASRLGLSGYNQEEYQFYDQDVLNSLIRTGDHHRDRIHMLPEMFNHFIRGVATYADIVPIGVGAKSIGVRVLHVASYQEKGRLPFFEDAARLEGWYQESEVHVGARGGAPIGIVVISHNQASSVDPMNSFIKKNFPGCPSVFVLDRCSDSSEEEAKRCGAHYIVNREGLGFLAGRMRDKGLEEMRRMLGYVPDMLFLDGDRIPAPGLTYRSASSALGLYDVTLLPVDTGEFRGWFAAEQFVENPRYGSWDNEVYTCGILMRSTVVSKTVEFQGGVLFVKDFDGQFGEEDQYLGDVLHKLGFTCGGAPRTMALSGGFRPGKDRVGMAKNIEVRHRLRNLLGFPDKASPLPAQRAALLAKIRGGLR